MLYVLDERRLVPNPAENMPFVLKFLHITAHLSPLSLPLRSSPGLLFLSAVLASTRDKRLVDHNTFV
jgi:hypothetical protein